MPRIERRWGMLPGEWAHARDRLRALLEGVAREGSTVTYGEAAREAFGGRFSARSGALMDLLGEVDRQTYEAENIMIASLVVRADTGRPGEGYFRFLETLTPDAVADREAAWRREASRVWEAYGLAESER